ncbi:MAG: efflux RND transporter periplasmic adaptor subunit [Burkholderiales bacterium]|nr:efflux RND transporter periplasmic adaptor subunit [Burkholderiales bacterium]
MNKIYTGVAVAGIALAGTAAWWLQRPVAASAGSADAMARADAGAPGGARASGAGSNAPAGGAPGPGGSPGPAATAPVEVALAETITIVDDVQAVGSLKARQGVMVRPEVSGRIARLGFVDGQAVRQGQLLVQLDDTLQRAQLQQAKAQASIARTNLQRSRELLAQNFVSQSAVDQNAAALQVAEAQVALADAQLARMRVLAPFDGTAGLRVVDLGDYVKDGADIVKIEDLSALEVEFALPERYVARTRPGLPMELTLDAMPGSTFKGQVVAINSQVDANGRALLVRARVQNPGALLRPGMFARPRVVFARRDGAVAVPEEALVPLGTRQFLFKVVDGPGGGKTAQRQEARIGLRVPGKVEIVEGLKPGDAVVTAGQARLMRADATPVRVIELGQAGGRAQGSTGSTGGAAASGAGAASAAGSAGGRTGAASQGAPAVATAGRAGSGPAATQP